MMKLYEQIQNDILKSIHDEHQKLKEENSTLKFNLHFYKSALDYYESYCKNRSCISCLINKFKKFFIGKSKPESLYN